MICPEDIEVWKPVPVAPYSAAYEVSNYGRVRRTMRGYGARIGKPMAGNRRADGHLGVTLRLPQKRLYIFIHQLVLLAFRGPQPPGMITCHWDGDPSHNHIANLRWDTHIGNTGDERRLGRIAVGENSARSIFADADIIDMRTRRATGQSYRSIAKAYGASAMTVWLAVNGKTWKHLPFPLE